MAASTIMWVHIILALVAGFAGGTAFLLIYLMVSAILPKSTPKVSGLKIPTLRKPQAQVTTRSEEEIWQEQNAEKLPPSLREPPK